MTIQGMLANNIIRSAVAGRGCEWKKSAFNSGVVVLLTVQLLIVLLNGGCTPVPHSASAQAPEITGSVGSVGDGKIRFPIVYSDMDGTMLTSDGTSRPETIQAFRDYIACGGLLGLATGRIYDQVKPILEQVQPNLPVVLLSGGLVVDTSGNPAGPSSHLSLEAVRGILDVAASNQAVEGVIVHFSDKTISDRKSKRLDEFLKYAEITVQDVCDLKTCILEPLEKKEIDAPVKVLVLIKPDQADKLREQVAGAVGDSAKTMVGAPKEATVILTPTGINKAIALKQILEERGMSMSNLVAFGDSQNDVEMLSQAGVGIAMGNCHKDACKSALMVIGTNDTDAIAEVMRRIVMTEQCGTAAQ